MRAALAGLAMAASFLASPLLADTGWEKFFELSFGDLRAEAAEAQKSGRQGLLLMYHFDDCPYCERMKREVLARPDVQVHFRKRFRAVAIDTRGSQEVTGFAGKAMPEQAFARAAGIRATPSFDFLAADGSLLYRHGGAIYDPAEFMMLGDYVASGAHRTGSFAAYKQSKPKRGS